VREHEHYGFEYEHDDDNTAQKEKVHESDYINYTDTYEYSNDMARSAVERFLESEAEPEPEAKRPPSTPKYDDEEEYMTRLADARKERQRRREENPVPKPAVRVNVERPRRSHPVVVHEPVAEAVADEEWAPMAEEDFNSFRERYSEPHVMAPREPRAGERPRTAGARRRETDVPVEGPSPLRYMLGIILIGLLALMAFLAMNNRNLRLDLDRYQGLATDTTDSAVEITQLELALAASQESNAILQAELDAKAALLYELSPGGEYDPTDNTPGRPGDGYEPALPEPPAPEPVIHIVESGQMLSRIAFQHFGSSAQHYVNLIAAANGIENPNDIYIGQRLVIPVSD